MDTVTVLTKKDPDFILKVVKWAMFKLSLKEELDDSTLKHGHDPLL